MQGVQKNPHMDAIGGAPADRPWRQRLLAVYLLSRTSILWASMAGVAIVVSALVGGHTESTTLRLLAGLYGAILVPLTARAWLRARVGRRLGRKPHLGGAWFLIGFNGVAAVVICFGFSTDTGNALRRRGDWFLGASRGWLPNLYRQQLAHAAHWLEGLDGTYQPPVPRPVAGQKRVSVQGQPPDVVGDSPWYHPLAGPRRLMPPNSKCRFGAARHGNRPAECERGHCGVDLFLPEGTPVHAVHDGVVLKMLRSAAAGGRAGKFIWLSHRDGDIVSSYVHLQQIETRLRPGARVKSGEVIGTLGVSGLSRPVPHLHFALSVRQRGRRRYVDPEPLLWSWPLLPRIPTPRSSLVARQAP